MRLPSGRIGEKESGPFQARLSNLPYYAATGVKSQAFVPILFSNGVKGSPEKIPLDMRLVARIKNHPSSSLVRTRRGSSHITPSTVGK